MSSSGCPAALLALAKCLIWPPPLRPSSLDSSPLLLPVTQPQPLLHCSLPVSSLLPHLAWYTLPSPPFSSAICDIDFSCRSVGYNTWLHLSLDWWLATFLSHYHLLCACVCVCAFSQDASWTAQSLRGGQTSTVKDTMNWRMETTGLKRRSPSLEKAWDAQKDKSVSFLQLDHLQVIISWTTNFPSEKSQLVRMKEKKRCLSLASFDLFNKLIIVDLSTHFSPH